MRKLLLATVALAALALVSPASAQIYIGPDGFSVGPIYVPNPNYYQPPPPVYVQPQYAQPPVVIQQPAPPPPQVIIQQAPPPPQVIIQQAPPPPPVVVQQPAPPPPPVVVQQPAPQFQGMQCFVFTSGANIRQWVWGPIVAQVSYGTPLVLFGGPQYAGDGTAWFQTQVGSTIGWISSNIVNCR